MLELLAYRLADCSDLAYCSFGVRYSVVDKQIVLTNMGSRLVNSYFDFHMYRLVLSSQLLAVVVDMAHKYC